MKNLTEQKVSLAKEIEKKKEMTKVGIPLAQEVKKTVQKTLSVPNIEKISVLPTKTDVEIKPNELKNIGIRKLLLIGNDTVDSYKNSNYSLTRYGIEAEYVSLAEKPLSYFPEVVGQNMKPYHTDVLVLGLEYSMWKVNYRVKLGSFVGTERKTLYFHADLIDRNDDFKLDHVVPIMNKLTQICRSVNRSVTVWLVIPSLLDIVSLNAIRVRKSNFPGMHPNYYVGTPMNRKQLQAYRDLTSLAHCQYKWTDKHILFGQDALDKIPGPSKMYVDHNCASITTLQKYLDGNISEIDISLGLYDGLHPTRAFVLAFWAAHHKFFTNGDNRQELRSSNHTTVEKLVLNTSQKTTKLTPVIPNDTSVTNLLVSPHLGLDVERRSSVSSTVPGELPLAPGVEVVRLAMGPSSVANADPSESSSSPGKTVVTITEKGVVDTVPSNPSLKRQHNELNLTGKETVGTDLQFNHALKIMATTHEELLKEGKRLGWGLTDNEIFVLATRANEHLRKKFKKE